MAHLWGSGALQAADERACGPDGSQDVRVPREAAPGSTELVLSSRAIPDVESYRSLAEALRALKDENVVFIIGGGEVFRQALPIVDGLHLTIVDGKHEGDTFFPEYEHLIGTTFVITGKEDHEGFSFVDYIRLGRTPT